MMTAWGACLFEKGLFPQGNRSLKIVHAFFLTRSAFVLSSTKADEEKREIGKEEKLDGKVKEKE